MVPRWSISFWKQDRCVACRQAVKSERPAGNQQPKHCRQPQQGGTPVEQQLQHCQGPSANQTRARLYLKDADGPDHV